jgi:hypothetical protein
VNPTLHDGSSCAVTALAWSSVELADVPKLRRQPMGSPALTLALRFADEQTVAALMTARQAIQERGWVADAMKSYGVVMAPRFFGRSGTATALDRFVRQGPVGVSPMAVPSYCLHASAGSLSLFLGLQGPSFGAGSGPNHVTDGFMSAMALLADDLAASVWLVFSAFDPEPELDAQARCQGASTIHAVAMALSQAANVQAVGRLRFEMPSRVADSRVTGPPIPLTDLMTALRSGADAWQGRLMGGGTIKLLRTASGVLSNAA